MSPLDYAQLGLAVFPCHYPTGTPLHSCSCGNPDCGSPAKHPHGSRAPNGFHSASKDQLSIKRWCGGPYNIGVATGAVSGVVVMDIDPRNDGDESLAQLEAEYGPLPPTWRAFTGGGGEHVWLRHPGAPIPCSQAALAPGIDIKADGGYVIAPRSRHISGRAYAWNVDHHPADVPIADMPEWLKLRISPQPKTSSKAAATPESWRELVAEGVDEGKNGGRDAAVTRLAGHLLRRYVDPHVVLDLCLVWNACRCRPPLPERVVLRIVNSIAARELARREAADGR